MKVYWTNTAEGHLDAIFGYIAQNSPEYAKSMVDRITRRSQQIAEYPLSGRVVPEYDFNQIREVIEGSYRIIYHIKSDQVDVLAVIHGAMNINIRHSSEEANN
jgi:plasmid stabilization system protein ParE